ncbi:MAG: diphosphate--fructose-6-phosphate 1-phosphotransferase, partial [Chlamydiota bacterium]
LAQILQNLASLQLEKKKVKETSLKEIFPHTYAMPIVTCVTQKNAAPVQRKPLRVGVVFSGGQASGGHNVIAGLFDALTSLCSKSRLFGFLEGPGGILKNETKEITKELLTSYRNQGGFDLIGSGRTKIETKEQLAASIETMKHLSLDGLVIIGGDDSNTNAAILAEYFLAHGLSTKVIGVPKTIDGDLQNEFIDISFGFDTACKVYNEMIGNIAQDALSAKKYYHFIKLMGRSASHIALECALTTHPNITLIGEEIAAKNKTLLSIGEEIADSIQARTAQGKNYGVVLIPEGLIEFIPEMKLLIQELNRLLADIKNISLTQRSEIEKKLSTASVQCFRSLPEKIQTQLLLDRDPHGNVQVSQIETEKLLIDTVQMILKKRNFSGKFHALQHFFGYEGRCSLPSNFDAKYCYALGHVAALLIEGGFTGYMSTLSPLTKPIEEWEPKGIPLTSMIILEERKGIMKPVIKKALVDLSKKPFVSFMKNRKKWEIEDCYVNPGPIQFFGEKEITDIIPISLM